MLSGLLIVCAIGWSGMGFYATSAWALIAVTLFEIGIAMSTVAIITRRHWLWFSALAFGAVGLVLLASAYLA